MRDDLLREQLMGYAHDGAEQAFQPGAADIHRRARRHAQRLAAVAVAGVVAAGGIALGIGLRHPAVPVVNRPRPPVTVTPAAKPPDSFVTVIPGGAGADSGDLAVVSTATGEMVRSLAPVNSTTFTVSTDRRWVYYEASLLPGGIYRVPYAGGAATRVSGATEISQLRVSPDGSRLAWEAMAGNRPALRVRDLARGSERVLPLPGPLSGPRIISRGAWTWSPDGRQLAVQVVHGISSGYAELMTVDAATGTWRHRFNFDARHGAGDCCEGIAWPAGSRRLAVVRVVYGDGGAARAHQLMWVDPATGATTAGPVLAGPEVTFYPLEFDPSGRYALFGTQDDHSLSTWWWSPGAKPVRVKRVEIGGQVPADVAGAYVGGAW